MKIKKCLDQINILFEPLDDPKNFQLKPFTEIKIFEIIFNLNEE